jgi:hypothetical protein
VTHHHDGDRGRGTGGGDVGTDHHDDDDDDNDDNDDNDDSRMRHEQLLRVKAPLFRNQLGMNK